MPSTQDAMLAGGEKCERASNSPAAGERRTGGRARNAPQNIIAEI